MLSVFDLFKIGIGPSSSHTVGPMLAARRFAAGLADAGLLAQVTRIEAGLYGSLALTGEGHGTISAVLLGLEGQAPDSVDPATVTLRTAAIRDEGELLLAGRQRIAFAFARDLLVHKHQFLPRHANGMRFRALDGDGRVLQVAEYYSTGGGFVQTAEEMDSPTAAGLPVPFPFASAAELIAVCRAHNLSIAQVMLANESASRTAGEVRAGLLAIAEVMQECIRHGCEHEGELPGLYHVRRRAPGIMKKLTQLQFSEKAGRADIMLWPMVYAIAVSEENASGGRIVTAPTNGAAGIIPAVLQYYRNFAPNASDEGIVDFLLTAAAIGMLYKLNASISGAEVGCQGEIGVACSMAAGAYCAVLGGTLAQIENAAEIAMEHHLGLTCDPVGGLVQVPCVERNGVAAEKAIKVAQLALLESGEHLVSLDKVIETMLRTGRDMQHHYKETALGGLALTVGVPAC
ncbi:L-serine ammonia-lyase [Chitinilyticum piscinae]|uniref:L-serine dehydratase n=1 Tax=Chitinilyticum piscinae TaxID=2866724 RepID=A0A8J7KBY7_9NEIS|nr:L-serine ammonia-lyase [Chitinilyticum piscinae]MBE9610729.1 L-serine ammonia-lyase [Chitinilyticum piscinae]